MENVLSLKKRGKTTHTQTREEFTLSNLTERNYDPYNSKWNGLRGLRKNHVNSLYCIASIGTYNRHTIKITIQSYLLFITMSNRCFLLILWVNHHDLNGWSNCNPMIKPLWNCFDSIPHFFEGIVFFLNRIDHRSDFFYWLLIKSYCFWIYEYNYDDD